MKMTGETPEVRSNKRKPREDTKNHRYLGSHRYHGSHKERKKKEKREKRREKEKEKRERKDRKGEKRRKKMSRVNYYQSAFNSQKEKLIILAKMLEISKTGLDLYISI